MNWFKKILSWNNGIPLMEQYNKGDRPYSSFYQKDPRSLVSVPPTYLGKTHKRKGYPTGISQFDEEDTQQEKLHQHLPGIDHENPLMEQDPATGEGPSRDPYKDDFADESDKLPYGGHSQRVDEGNGRVGPHNMQSGGVFRKIKNKARSKIRAI